MKRRIIRHGVVAIASLVTHRWVTGEIMSFVVEDPIDDLVIDALVAMWFGGVKVSAYRGHVTSRFK